MMVCSFTSSKCVSSGFVWTYLGGW